MNSSGAREGVRSGAAMTARVLDLLCIALVALTACNGERANSTRPTVRDSAGIRIVENTEPQWGEGKGWRLSATPLLQIGVESGDPNYEFERVVSVLQLSDDRIAVADQGAQMIRLYDRDGAFVRSVGGSGSGPGEYRHISSMRRYRTDSLSVYDANADRISILGPNLGFARSVMLSSAGEIRVATSLGSFPDGSWLLEGSNFTAYLQHTTPGVNRIGMVLLRFDAVAGRVDSLAEAPGMEMLVELEAGFPNSRTLPFGLASVAGIYHDGYLLASSDTYEIRHYDGANQLQQIVRRYGAERRVTANDIEAIRTRLVEAPVPDDMPAFGRFGFVSTRPVILVDNVHNTWVLDYHFSEDAPESWAVLDPGGTYLGTIAFPIGFTPLDIADDQIVGVWQDEMDVQYVRVYGLEKD